MIHQNSAIHSLKEILNHSYIEDTEAIKTTVSNQPDYDIHNSDFTGWNGEPLDIFGSPFSPSIINMTTDNPKKFVIAFQNTANALQIGIGENNGGSFSNVKITLLGSGGVTREIVDMSTDDTKLTSYNFQFENELFNNVCFEFFTSDPVSVSNIVIISAGYNTSQITGKTSEGDFVIFGASDSGNLKIQSAEDGLNIAQGNVLNTTYIHKFGEAANLDTIDGFAEIWDGVNNLVSGKVGSYTYSITNDITSVSSSSVADTQNIEVFGLDINYNEITQTITLNGQNEILLNTPLIRIVRMINRGTITVIGEVYCYTSGATVSNGVPSPTSTIRAVINNGNNQTLMAIYTIPAGKTGYMRDWYSSLSKDKNTTCVVKLRARPFGQVFHTKHTASISSTGSSYIQHKYEEPEIFNEKTDISIIGDTSTNDSGIGAGFDIVLVDN